MSNSNNSKFLVRHPWDQYAFPGFVALIWLVILMGFVPEIVLKYRKEGFNYPLAVHIRPNGTSTAPGTPVRGTRLFGEAGPSFRASGNLQSSIPPSWYGFTAGAGIEKRAKGIGIAPALRYTRWSEGQGYGGSRGGAVYNPNSVELIVGVSF